MEIKFNTEYLDSIDLSILTLLLDVYGKDLDKKNMDEPDDTFVNYGDPEPEAVDLSDEQIEAPNDEPLQYDSFGIPWDARIHASSKAKNADGSWRKVRNLDTSVFDMVMCELELLKPPKVAPAPIIVAEETIVVAEETIVVAEEITFNELIKRIGSAMATKSLTTDIINTAVNSLELTSIAELSKKPEVIPVFLEMLCGLGHEI